MAKAKSNSSGKKKSTSSRTNSKKKTSSKTSSASRSAASGTSGSKKSGGRASGSKASSAKASAAKSTRAASSKRSQSAKARNTSSGRNKVAQPGIPMANEVILITSFGIMLILMLSNFGLCGPLGRMIDPYLFGFFGCMQYIMPIAFFIAVMVLTINNYNSLSICKVIAGFVTLMMIDAFVQLIYQGDDVSISELFSLCGKEHLTGGIIGGTIGIFLKNYLGVVGTMIVLFCVLMISLVVLTQRSFVDFFQSGWNTVADAFASAKSAASKAKDSSEAAASQAEESKEETSGKTSGSKDDYEEITFDDEPVKKPKKKPSWGAFLKMKSGREVPSEKEEEPQQSVLDRKLKELEEEKTRKLRRESKAAAEKSATAGKTAAATGDVEKTPENNNESADAADLSADTPRKMQKLEVKVSVPSFTASGDVKRKDQTQELHTVYFPLTSEDGKTDPFEGELDFSAFSFNSGKSPEEFQEEIRIHNQAWKEMHNSDAFVPPYKSKGAFMASELNPVSEESEESDGVEEEMTIQLPERSRKENTTKKMLKLSPVDRRKSAAVAETANVESGDVETAVTEATVAETAYAESGDAETAVTEAALAETVATETAATEAADTGAREENSQDSPSPLKANFAETEVVKGVSASPDNKDGYTLPVLSLLDHGISETDKDKDFEHKATAKKLQDTLKSFGVNVTMTGVSCGPAVTRYELVPEAGTKVSKIVSLTDDIKLNLAAADIRIEAPIPGKSAIGIEVPNDKSTVVHFSELVESKKFRNQSSKISFAVGKDIGGNIVVSDLAKMPHLLIAGATGSGKSVCINTLIMSILYKAKPEEVKMIMIDPKKVELSCYKNIPHLLMPVVTDPKKAAAALNWACHEMMCRYDKFTESGVRNIEEYNKNAASLTAKGDIDAEKADKKKLPQIVIIIDELADLMMVAQSEVEDAIVRLSQLARAAGIHLVIATQRPSVNVITGLIKANVPSRIAFAVTSGIDSRTILDMNGAEKLLGKGDMLFYPQGYQKPVRVQGALISDKEVARVVDFIREQNMKVAEDTQKEQNEVVTQMTVNESTKDQDEYFEAAARFIMEKDKATIGMLQRMFKIGFNRAARIMDQLAEAGIVGPEEGTKPRKILMSPEQLEEYFQSISN